MKSVLFGLCCLTLFATAHAASAYTGADLAKWQMDHEHAPNSYGAGLYYGYVMAIGEALKKGELLCPAPGTKAQEIAALVSTYVKKHPEMHVRDADTVILMALEPMFGCKK